jgi:hypothetical protein
MDTNALSLDKESMRLGLFADESTIFKLPPVKVIGYLWIQLSVFRNENRRKCADIVVHGACDYKVLLQKSPWWRKIAFTGVEPWLRL